MNTKSEWEGLSPTMVYAAKLLSNLPGLGKRSSARIVAHIVQRPKEEILELADAIRKIAENVKVCSICFNISDYDPCPICSDAQRDSSQICVVETAYDLSAIESAGFYNGKYHVLGGALDTLAGITPAKLHIQELLDRINTQSVREIIFATNPTPEGNNTADYITRFLDNSKVKITRLARGLSAGTTIEFADFTTLKHAFESRENLNK